MYCMPVSLLQFCYFLNRNDVKMLTNTTFAEFN
jgi:hypothetical protein